MGGTIPWAGVPDGTKRRPSEHRPPSLYASPAVDSGQPRQTLPSLSGFSQVFSFANSADSYHTGHAS